MKKIRRIVLFLVMLLFIAFFIYTLYSIYHGKKEYIKKQYNGIITEIRTLEGNRDLPDIKFNNQWISLDILESKVKHYIQVGDSISKESGTEEIKVYRKDSENKWDVRVFK